MPDDAIGDNLGEKVEELQELSNKIPTEQKKTKEIKTLTSQQRDRKICRYWNRGCCRNNLECSWLHAEKDCESFIQQGYCEERSCRKRHRRICRCWARDEGCQRGHNCQ